MIKRWENLLVIQGIEIVPTALCELAEASFEITHSSVSTWQEQSAHSRSNTSYVVTGNFLV
jgi:hypothetical protein